MQRAQDPRQNCHARLVSRHSFGPARIGAPLPGGSKDIDMAGNLLIRADATTDIGNGHLMRCFALALEWRAHGGSVTLLSHCKSDVLRLRLEAAGMDFIPLEKQYPDPADLHTTVEVLERQAGEWLVLDGYHFDASYHQAVRSSGYKLLVVDDTAHLPFYDASILLNQNVCAEQLSYRCAPETIMLLGLDYALLRPEFRARLDRSREIPEVARRVLVTMGGGDPYNVTSKVLTALVQTKVDNLEATIVVGANNPHFDELDVAIRHRQIPTVRGVHPAIRLMRDVSDMSELMAWADVAVSAGGSTCWELVSMGLPSIVLILADNQRRVAEGLCTMGAAVNLGWFEQVTEHDISTALAALCHSYDERVRFSQAGRRLVDGDGSDRVVTMMNALSRRGDIGQLEIREADFNDVVPLWRLANDSGVRSNSFNPDPIPFERHLEWYKSKLTSPESCIWIVEFGGTIAAQVRYDRVGDGAAEIDFSVSPALRGRGIGTQALVLSVNLAFERLRVDRVRGVVKKANAASAGAFKKAGFTQILGSEGDSECIVFERGVLVGERSA